MLIVKNAGINGREFAVVLVRNGERYGRDFCLTNAPGEKFSDGSTLVEFWDLTHHHGPVRPGSAVWGQFTGARYNLATLLENGGYRGVGLRLDGGIAVWTVDGQAMSEVSAWLFGVHDREILESRVGVRV